VRLGDREFSWRRSSRSAKAGAAEFTLRLAVPVLLLAVTLLPEPARLILLPLAVALGGLMLKRPAAAWLMALKARRYRQDVLAENRRENAQVTDRYEHELKDVQARYRRRRADRTEDPGDAGPP
jgi:hypothetical protein